VGVSACARRCAWALGDMNEILESAHTWFFESATMHLDQTLAIRLAEGIKSPKRRPVDVGVTTLGPYFPVTVTSASRCVLVSIPHVVAHFEINESYPTIDPDSVSSAGQFLVTVERTAFSGFIASATQIPDLCQESLLEYRLWCEDRIFYALSHGVPTVQLLPERPDLTFKRGNTWSSN
jgi:hypothetical protein